MGAAPLARRRQDLSGRLTLGRLSLRWRLSLAIFGLLAVLLGGLAVLLSFTEEQALLRNEASALYDAARLATPVGSDRGHILTTRGALPPPVGAPPADLVISATALTQHLDGLNIAASVTLPNGIVIASTAFNSFVTTSTVMPVSPSPAAIHDTLTMPVDPGAYTLANGSDGQRQLYILLPMTASGATVALVEISTRTTPIDHAVATLRLILFLGIGGALLLAGACALPLVGAALRPLRQMERASRRIAGGALSLRLKEPEADDEVGRLTHSFNVMVARLEEAFARQKRFVSDVSHELRTPLTALGGGLEMLMLGADAGDAEAQRRLVRGMYAETERMRRLVENLLTLARLDEGHLPPRLASLDVAALVRDVADQAERLASGQVILLDVGQGPLFAQADADQLRQVLLNLVENALKFTPAGGTITLAASRAAGPPAHQGVVIAVRDTGMGIPQEAQAHVFDRFYRADFARSRPREQPGGSGLGLSIARSLVEAQGGTIALESGVGRGTAVTLTLPATVPIDGGADGVGVRGLEPDRFAPSPESEPLPRRPTTAPR
jgi:two-component system OmpR family sensor kinase